MITHTARVNLMSSYETDRMEVFAEEQRVCRMVTFGIVTGVLLSVFLNYLRSLACREIGDHEL